MICVFVSMQMMRSMRRLLIAKELIYCLCSFDQNARDKEIWSLTVNTSKGIRAAVLLVAFLGASQVSLGQAPSSCSIAYSVASQWNNGFQGDVKIINGSTALTSWTLTWTFASG